MRRGTMTLIDPARHAADTVLSPVASRDAAPSPTTTTDALGVITEAAAPAVVRVVAWRDPVVDVLGVDPRSYYVEQFWLPVIGPTCTWLLRRIVARLEHEEVGFSLDLDETARSLGLGGRQGRNGPFRRALSRCITFELARWQGKGTLGVRRLLPPLSRRHVIRLPAALQEAHEQWTDGSAPGSLDGQRRRARRLALGLVALGEPFDGAEAQLMRWGVHPSLTHDAVHWARRLQS